MLRLLKIKNLAVIEDLVIELDQGFNVLTGETGAGKSLIIGAIEILLGDKSDPTLIRSGEDEMVVTGQFDIDPCLVKLMKDYGIEGEELVIQRIIRRNTKSQTRINNEIASVSTVKKIGDLLVDILGQHQHQKLLNRESQLETLDSFAGIENRVDKFSEKFKQYKELKEQLRILKEKRHRKQELADLHRYQYEELRKAQLRPDEENEMKDKLRIIENTEELSQVSQFALSSLFEDDNSVLDQLSEIRKKLTKLTDVDNKIQESVDYLDTAYAAINECSNFINDYLENIEFDQTAAAKLRNRLNAIIDLKIKYKKNVNELIEYLQELGNEEADFDNLNASIKELEGELDVIRDELQKEGLFLSEKRRKATEKLENMLRVELMELGMNQFKFQTEFSHRFDDESDFVLDGQGISLFPHGFDEVEFYISLNVGEELKPLNKIVSGGELSRIMLSFKRILAEQDRTPVLIFDEIDSGVGGKTAVMLGHKLKNLEKSHQVIVISHLHQIASQAGTHFFIEKLEKDERTHVKVYKVEGEARVRELTRMMGVEKDKKYAQEFAEDLLAR